MAAPPSTTVYSGALSIDSSADASPSSGDHGRYINEARPTSPITISLQEWQAWGTDSPLPTQVAEIVEEMIVSETESDAQMKFGGLGGKLKVSGIQTLFPFYRLQIINLIKFSFNSERRVFYISTPYLISITM